ncbi:MAG: glycosyltransferase [Segniliparus sp.]|uniref:glycosyltransferase n=1 Tax=Segniliparus sp. TaxID=2804064 RepID=UPI003F3B93D3
MTLGSRGDVQPVIALGLALQSKGHDVVIACMGSSLVSLVESAGLEAHELIHSVPDHDEDYQKSMHNPIARVRAWREHMKDVFPKISLEITAACEGADVVLAHSDAMDLAISTSLRTKSMVLGYRFFPGTMNSAYPVTQYTPAGAMQEFLNRSPGFVKRASWWAGHRITWLNLSWAVNHHRGSLGLSPFASLRERDASVAAIPDLQLYDSVLTPELVREFGIDKPMLGFLQVPPRAWRRNAEQERADDELKSWIEAGEPPIYWGFGSIRVENPDQKVQMFADICKRNGQRGLVVAGWSDLAVRDLGDHVRVVEAVDHATILPLCKAAVHHGGAGTTAACLRAGLPSLICSVLADQPFWGRRIEALGAGVHIPIRKLHWENLEKALQTLLKPVTAQNARKISVLMDTGSVSADRAVRVIESFVSAGRRSSAA